MQPGLDNWQTDNMGLDLSKKRHSHTRGMLLNTPAGMDQAVICQDIAQGEWEGISVHRSQYGKKGPTEKASSLYRALHPS